MAKRLSEEDKKQVVNGFTSGKTVEELSNIFNCTKLTISRNLKKQLGDKKFQELINSKYLKETILKKDNINSFEEESKYQTKSKNEKITRIQK